MIISQNLGYVSAEQNIPLLDEMARIGRMINGMLSGLEKKLTSPRMPNAEC